MRRPSLKIRITAWFALMMFVIEALVLSFLLAVNGTIVTNDPESRLVRMVEHNADRVKYKNRQFRYDHIHYYRSGVYTVLYDADGNALQGTFPAEFSPAQPLPLSGDAVRTVTCGEQTFYVYDVHVDMMVGSVWLRGVIDANAKGGVMRVIMPLAWSLLPVLLVLSVIGGYFIANRALRPVRQLTAAANAISDGQDLKARIGLPHTKGSDEIYQLSASFDNMFDRLERSFEAEQRFTSDASHELRTPTTVILAACEDARKNAATPADYQAALDVVDRQAHKMSQLIASMLEITRLDQGTQKVNWEYADLSDLVTVICDEQTMVARRGIRIGCAAEPDIFIDMDVFLMSRVVQNLLDNAFKFGIDGGWIHVALRRTDAGVQLTVQDNGVGIAQEDLDRIWQRFYQADPSRQESAGLGLGLSMVQQIVALHGGTVAVASAKGRGTTFTVTLPPPLSSTGDVPSKRYWSGRLSVKDSNSMGAPSSLSSTTGMVCGSCGWRLVVTTALDAISVRLSSGLKVILRVTVRGLSGGVFTSAMLSATLASAMLTASTTPPLFMVRMSRGLLMALSPYGKRKPAVMRADWHCAGVHAPRRALWGRRGRWAPEG